MKNIPKILFIDAFSFHLDNNILSTSKPNTKPNDNATVSSFSVGMLNDDLTNYLDKS